jgi:hypothetical protein
MTDTTTITGPFTDASALSPADQARVLAIAGGDYQRRLLSGVQGWSSFDVQGGARRWGSSYRDSRRVLVSALQRCGFHVDFRDSVNVLDTIIITRA